MPRPLLIAANILLLTLYATAPGLHAQAPSSQLAAVLDRMDTASKGFKHASADFQGDLVQRVAGITDVTKQKGSMYIEREKNGTSFGAAIYEFEPNTAPAAKPSTVVNYSGGTLRVYTPGTDTVQLFKAGAGQGNLEGYFSLGFGGSGHDLAAAWEITDKGPVTLEENGHPIQTEMLVLVSKDPGVRNNFRQVTLWIDPLRDVSLKQVFETPSGVQRTANYSNIRLTGNPDKSAFTIPKNASVARP